MNQFLQILGNWLALIGGVFVNYIVGRYITSKMVETPPSGKFGSMLLWIGRILGTIATHMLLSFLFPMLLMFSLYLTNVGWKIAFRMPYGQSIAEAGTATIDWGTDVFYALTGQEEKVQNKNNILLFPNLDKFASGGGVSTEVNPTAVPEILPTQVGSTPVPEILPTQVGQTPVPQVQVQPTANPDPQYLDVLRQVNIMGCIDDGNWAKSTLPPGTYLIADRDGKSLFVQPLTGAWQDITGPFCITRDASKEISTENKKMDTGDTFSIY